MEDSREDRPTNIFDKTGNSYVAGKVEVKFENEDKHEGKDLNSQVAKNLKMSIETGRAIAAKTGTSLSVRSNALTDKDLEIVRAEMAKDEFKLTGK